MSLSEKTCIPCRGGIPPLTRSQFEPLLTELSSWQVINESRLRKTYKTKDFAEALALANKIGALAEQQGHHPDLTVRWGELIIDLWTHKIDGLTESDFILAAKIDKLI
jgi:4a-hydroxytetrahydrobiopterin dehydratase